MISVLISQFSVPVSRSPANVSWKPIPIAQESAFRIAASCMEKFSETAILNFRIQRISQALSSTSDAGQKLTIKSELVSIQSDIHNFDKKSPSIRDLMIEVQVNRASLDSIGCDASLLYKSLAELLPRTTSLS